MTIIRTSRPKDLPLFMLGFVTVLGACFVSRYARPDWTAVIVSIMAIAGTLMSFAAGRLSR